MKKRKEISLHKSVIDKLQILADKKKWSLKKYMEEVLKNESHKATKYILNELKK